MVYETKRTPFQETTWPKICHYFSSLWQDWSIYSFIFNLTVFSWNPLRVREIIPFLGMDSEWDCFFFSLLQLGYGVLLHNSHCYSTSTHRLRVNNFFFFKKKRTETVHSRGSEICKSKFPLPKLVLLPHCKSEFPPPPKARPSSTRLTPLHLHSFCRHHHHPTCMSVAVWGRRHG